MVTTGFAETMRPIINRLDRDADRRVTSADWTSVGLWSSPAPSTNTFAIRASARVDTTDLATTGELRFVAVDANGAEFTSDPVTITGIGRFDTKWVEVKAQGASVVDFTIDVQMRRTGGTGALLAAEVQPLWFSNPSGDVQESNQLDVAGQSDDWTDGPGTLTNPIQGTGNSLLFISVSPGPGFDDLNGATGSWVRPPGATVLREYEVQDASASFVQRVGFYFMPVEDGAASYTFGYQAPASWPADQRTQSTTVIGFDGSTTAVSVFGPTVDNALSMPYPTAPAASGFTALAVATGQNNGDLTGSPSAGGWTQVMNNTALPAVLRRSLAVYSQQTVGQTEIDPGNQTWTAGSPQGAHVHWVVTVPAGSGGTAPSAYTPLNTALMSFNLDPSDITTFGRERVDKQLINAGPAHNPPPPTGGNNFTAGWGTGYDMTWNAAGDEVTIPGSNTAPDGETRRMWVGAVGGIPTLEALMLWTGTGYGSYQSPMNLDVVWPDSDRLFVDGSRILHYSDSDGSHFRCGPGATEETYVVVFPTKQWMIGPGGTSGAMNNCTGPLDFHAHPSLPLPSPLYMNVREGEVEFIHRSRSGTGALDLSTGVTGNDLDVNGTLYSEPLEPLDGFNAFIVQFKIDPTTSDRFIRAYKVDPATGARSLLFTDTAQRGYYLTGSGTYNSTLLDGTTVSGEFYPIHQYYVFHASTSTADAAAGVVHNWDANTSRVGPFPTMRTGAVARCFEGSAFTLEENTNEIRHVLGLI